MENKKEVNCKNCIRFATCKFVDENKTFATTNKMYAMFSYAEHNNLQAIFYQNAKSCKFFIADDINADEVKEKIKGAIWGFEWLKGYIQSFSAEYMETYKENAIKAADGYLDKLK